MGTMKTSEFIAKLPKENCYEIRVTMYRSGVVKVHGDLPGGKVGVTLTAMKTSPPSGTYHFTDEENTDIDDALSAVIYRLGQIIEKANRRIIDGISDR